MVMVVTTVEKFISPYGKASVPSPPYFSETKDTQAITLHTCANFDVSARIRTYQVPIRVWVRKTKVVNEEYEPATTLSVSRIVIFIWRVTSPAHNLLISEVP